MAQLLNIAAEGLRVQKNLFDQLKKDYPDIEANIDYKTWGEVMNEQYQKYIKESKSKIDYASWLDPDGRNWFIDEFIEPSPTGDKKVFNPKKLEKTNWLLLGGIVAGSLTIVIISALLISKKHKAKEAAKALSKINLKK